jgi:peptidyl-prolyl cis-trans isomerase SurA
MAEQNNVPGGNLEVFLSQHGVPPETLRAQAKAGLTWNKVVMRELRPRIEVGDDEVQAAVDRIKANAGKQEFLVNEIFLAVDNPKDDAQVKNIADQLAQQIRTGGNFAAIARQFSQGTGAANGGDIGWVQEGQLSPELNKALLATREGQITDPVRSSNGWHILGVRETRTVAAIDIKASTINLQQVFRTFTSGEDKQSVLQEASKLREAVSGCGDLFRRVQSDFPRWRWMDLGDVAPDKAPAWISERTAKLSVGRSTEPMATDKGALILFLCRRDGTPNIDRNEILNTIGSERLELLARREIRDMRRKAYIDVRLKIGS